MRLPPYARSLLARRQSGENFWLAIVAVGWLRDSSLFQGDSGIARIGCPPELPPDRFNWNVITGLDVLCVMYAGSTNAFWRQALEAIWSGRPSTLWALVEPDVSAERVEPGPFGFCRSYEGRVRLDVSFKSRVKQSRETAFLTAAPPFFNDPSFDAARSEAVRRLAA